SDNYLEVNDRPNDRQFESLFKRIISVDKWSQPETQQDIEDTKIVGFCLKTKDLSTNEKLFVNFCHSSMMKAPTLDLNEEELRQLLASEDSTTPTLDLNEEELRQLLASEDSTSFTIPLILSQFKPTVDKSGSDDGNDGLDYEYVNTNINNKLIENINNSNNDGNYGPKTKSDSDRVKRPQTQTILNHSPLV
ncbi:unnamed protein product, partial [Oppiella nova]